MGLSSATDAVPLATGVTFSEPLRAAATLLLFACLALLITGSIAALYRWYFRQRAPEGVAVLFGVSVVVLYLNTTSLGGLIGGGEFELLRLDAVLFNVVAVGVAAAVSPAGLRVGDTVARNVFAMAGGKRLEGEVGAVVRTVGRVTPVTLPAVEDIEDMESYEAVSPDRKAEMAEKTLLFPRRLTVEELRTRLVARVKEDFGITYVDVDVDERGEIEYFAVGSRAAGLGPTLAPGTAAVAITADPANTATPGDVVQVWRGGEAPERVATAELRATAGDVATLALDAADAERLDDATAYRLVTLPAQPQADREFASLLRSADETMSVVTVAEGSELVGTAVGDVSAVVAAIRPAEGSVRALPPRSDVFEPGDAVYLVGRLDAIRRFEAAATTPAEPADEGGSGTDEVGTGADEGGVRDEGDTETDEGGMATGEAGPGAGTAGSEGGSGDETEAESNAGGSDDGDRGSDPDDAGAASGDRKPD
uniref:TrkA C-terminal domain-containing protein n=1 Tax=Halopenitus persicus TaxID=1048396 RepID=UPI00210CF539|nr:potassium transporter TrkA [Halopenitus persicus]